MYRIYFVIVTTCIAGYVIYNLMNNPKIECNECLNEKKTAFSGVVDTIIRDKQNPSQSFIYLKDGRKILPDYTYGLWIEVRSGDSIVKQKGTLDYLIYEKRNGYTLKHLNWDKKCQ